MAIRILILATLLLVSTAITAQTAVPDEYMIDTGDVIVIDVYNEKDLYVRTMVNAQGIVKLPLIGSISVSGKPPSVLESEIEAALFDGYLVEPDVSVTIEKYRPFYIKGAVKLPGVFDFRLNLTVEQAIAIGGGLRDRASKSDWYILRGAAQNKVRVKKDTPVFPGDILHIEESVF
ncbi:polysaccharide biosynthesis/export family protein [Aliiglaciecola litoralis]|uniref:Polysaccharide biosynthesis/export family protein n=1 Tax=Aliiglaciecola litoralis TaxID=582857 RepID=A0ABN1LTS4_9ALTE